MSQENKIKLYYAYAVMMADKAQTLAARRMWQYTARYWQARM